MDLLSFLPSSAELIAAAPIIISLVILEGLLSFDNALVLATMVSHLPEKQQQLALKAGLLGAYVFRGLALIFVAFIIANPWIKVLGGAYLIYLMCSNLSVAEEGEEEQESGKANAAKGLVATIIAVEIADMAFSIDNIIAAVAMSPKTWVVVLGVFIGIAAMRFVAGIFVGLVKRFPILAKLAYVLVGYVGVQLLVEEFLHVEIGEMQKFATIIGILAFGVLYDKLPILQSIFGKSFVWAGQVMGNITELTDSLMIPVLAPIKAVSSLIASRFKKAA